MNVISSQRALGYANHFKKQGFEPTILTFDWSKDFTEQLTSKNDFESKIIREQHDNYEVIRIPVIDYPLYRWLGKQEGKPWYKLWVIWCWMIGQLDVNPRLLSFSKSESYFLKNFVQKEDYDVALGVYSPNFHLKHCYDLNRRFELPYVLDFRDLWHNRILNQNYNPSRSLRLQDYFTRKYWKKWLKNATVASITSEPWAKKLKEETSKDIEVVTNGFDPQELEGIDVLDDRIEEFKIVHIGSIYHQQKIKLIAQAIQDFANEHPKAKFKLYLIGAKRGADLEGEFSFNPFVEKILNEHLDHKYWEVTERKKRGEAMKWLNKAQVLLFPSFPDTPGTYSGKIFEYLMAQKNILMIPGDKDVSEALIKETNTGCVCNSIEEVTTYLREKYEEFEKSGNLVFNGNDSALKYTRENQTAVLAQHINSKLNE